MTIATTHGPTRPEMSAQPRARLAVSALMSWLGGLRYARWAALLGMLLGVASVFTGRQTEDHYHFSAIRGGGVQPPYRLNLFNYIDGNIGGIYNLKDFGTVPWFTLPDYKVSFWRPVTSFTHWVDYHYFPDSPWLAHCHSLLWYGALILAAAQLFKRLLPLPWMAALATFFYAIDDAHAHPVGWLANRNAILATLCGVLAIVAHDAWRGAGAISKLRRALAALLAPVALAVGLGCGEFAVGAVGYLAAHALFMDRVAGDTQLSGLRRWLTRALVVLPSLLVTGGWLFLYRKLGHGTYGTDFHLDPVADTARFSLQALWRLPALIAAQLFGIDSEAWWRLEPSTQYLLGALISLLIALFFYWLRSSLRSSQSRFWLVGMLLATLPACAALPQDRMLFFTGLGGLALICIAVRQYLERPAGHTHPAPAALIAALLLLHLVIAPITFPQRSLIMHRFGHELDRVGQDLMWKHPNDQEHLVLLGGPSYFYVASTLGLRATRKQRVPRHIRMLHAGRGPLKLTHSATQQLILEAPHGFYSDPFDGTYRGHQYPMKVGEGLQLTGMLIIVRGVDAQGVPTKIEVNLQRPVQRGNYHFMAWRRAIPGGPDGRFHDVPLPPVGESVELPSGY